MKRLYELAGEQVTQQLAASNLKHREERPSWIFPPLLTTRKR